MILDEKIWVTLQGKNVSHYEKLGYFIPRKLVNGRNTRCSIPKGTKILVSINDLPEASNELINLKCDYCNDKFQRTYNNVLRSRNKIGNRDVCCNVECRNKLRQESLLSKYGTTSSKEICEVNGSEIGRKNKYTIENLIDIFNNNNLTLCIDMIDDVDHITVKKQLPCICNIHSNSGIQYRTTADVVASKYCCMFGSKDALAQHQLSFSLIDVKQICDDRDYTLLSDKIQSVDSRIDYICNKHPNYGVQHTTYYGMKHYENNCRLCAMTNVSGPNHWNWRGGINDENELLRHNWQYSAWRQTVYKRDNYMCQCCGRKSGDIKLNAHHILNFSEYEDLRYDVDNGITLCEDCHSCTISGGFHNLYGTRDNTHEQLNEYIKNKQIALNLTVQN